VNIARRKPVIIEKLIWHGKETGDVQDGVDLSDYIEQWGHLNPFLVLKPAFTECLRAV